MGSPKNKLKPFAKAAALSGLVIEVRSDGTFSVPIELPPGTFRLHVDYEGGWALIKVPLSRIDDAGDPVLLHRLLQENLTIPFLGYYVDEGGTLGLKAEFPDLHFNPQEFTLALWAAVRQIDKAVDELKLTNPIE